MTDPRQYVDHPNVRAFLRAIRLGEGTADDDGYRRIVGGELFDDFADHPRRRVWIERYKVWSTAAGAYQFLQGTWDEMAQKYGLPDFSPASQDIAAVGLLIRRKALDAIIDGRIEEAVHLCRQEWASLPGSPYGQRTESMDRVMAEYFRHGGGVSGGGQTVTNPEPAPIVRNDTEAATPTFWERNVSPFLAAALPQLVKMIPELIRSFGSDGKVTERNAKAAEALLTTVQAATGAANAQDAIERLAADQKLLGQVRDKLEADAWFELTEAGGDGIAGARKAAVEVGERFWQSGVFWVTALLLPLLYGTVYLVLTGPEGAFSPELRAAIASSVVTGVLGGVIGYWLGLKFRTSRPAADN